jgi:hypothetical protein
MYKNDGVCVFASRSRTVFTDLHETSHAYSLRPREYRKAKSPEKFPELKVPVRVVSIARKLSAIEQLSRVEICLFRGRDCRNKGHKYEETVWGPNLGFCSSGTKQD